MNLPTFDAKQTIRYELASSGKSAVQYFQREDIVFSLVNRDEILIAKEKEQVQKEKLKLKQENKMAKKKAKETVELAQRKAHRAHMLLVLSEKRKREKVEKPIIKRSHSSENISRSVEQKTKRPKTTHRGEKLEH